MIVKSNIFQERTSILPTIKQIQSSLSGIIKITLSFRDSYKLIKLMRGLNRVLSSMFSKTSHQNTILKKSSPNRNLITNLSRFNFVGLNNIYQQIIKFKKFELIPIYLRYIHKCSHPGFNFKWNMSKKSNQLMFRLKTGIEKEEKIKEQEQGNTAGIDPKEKIEKQAKLAILAFLIFIVLYNFRPQEKRAKLSKEASQPFQLAPEINLDEETLIAKLFEGLKEVKIKEKSPEKSNQYEITFQYEDHSTQKFRYNGNINNLLAMIQSHESDKFQKTKIYLDHEEYSFWNSFKDSLGLLTPFIGIAITVFIFKKFTPDSLLSKISPKKSYKIQGLRDIKVKFDDVAGMEQAKKQITQFVDFLKHGEKYRSIGAKIPKGALLTGPPGTGKTMLAKATAGEAGVPFFYISGSQFVEIFVGMGASKVRELFSRARMEAPSIIFIDQIDAIGKKRQSSRNEQKDSTLNQLLVEMDGFGSHQTVIILAATNRKDILDNALTRPGRFDRMVEVTLPDIKAREQIFQVHLKPLKVDPNKKLVDVAKRLAQLTPGFSGADISNLCNQAAIIAIRKGNTYIQDKDFEDASERITAGYEKKGLSNPMTKKRVAYHEAGHAICGWFLKGGDPLVKLTIIPRSKGALGYAQYLPKSSYITTKNQLIDQIAIMLGGLTSEQLHFQQISSGASDDLQKVYQLSRRMVAQFGMGRRTYNITLDEQSHVRKQSQQLSKQMDQQMTQLIKEGQERCRQILSKNKLLVQKLAEMLLQKQTINTQDIKGVLGERPKFI